MGVFEKISKTAGDIAREAIEVLDLIMVGTHNVVRGITGNIDMKMLEQRRTKEREARTVYMIYI